MLLNLFTLQKLQTMVSALLLILFTSNFIVFSLQASPGAHGPNGEHLDTNNQAQALVNPKFEGFTEAYELVGELLDNQLIIYLHDFKTNIPVKNASIELDLDGQVAQANFSEQLGAYSLSKQALLGKLQQPSIHEIILTITTEESGDLLFVNLDNSKVHTAELSHGDEEHVHFPWHMFVVALAVFAGGVLLGRQMKGSKA
ncbi:hypothetical protein N480_14285 [Pseudoalteromonas luteoviolacea S2607]|uniref:hypothetical protein n=1 Tax=Pseudoalteromonas luteoviolacea TaxID=43657 RepID=UPI0007B092F6|nr:hypothetical protein [Pseudoalteromonas luteoviolacea]KZN37908.1 hypothetical protein N480_14285 [Pseudoalteromonas luteoviolacea S2607]